MRPITDVLRDIRKGRVVDDATHKLARVVESVMETKKAGTLTIELTVKPQKNDDEQVVIVSKVKAKTPEMDLPDAIFFVDDEFDLVRDDPKQRELFAEADAPATRKPRAVPAAAE